MATPLGTLGGAYTYAQRINASGWVTGYSATTGNASTHAFLHSGGTMQDLGTLGGTSSWGIAINNSGQVVGSSPISDDAPPNAFPPPHAFLYSAGTMQDLGTLGGTSSAGTGINDSGQVVGNSSLPAGGTDTHAFLYSTGAMQDLGTLGGRVSWATGINAGGQVVGASYLSGNVGNYHAFLYSGGTMQDLGTLGGGVSGANGINASGQVTGVSYLIGNAYSHAFLYSGGTMQDLGTLGGRNSVGNGINASGQVVGYSFITGNVWTHAFLYSEGVMHDLNTLVLSGLAGATLGTAHDINDNGQIIASSCRSSDLNQCVAYRLDPIPANHQGLWWNAPPGSESGWGINFAHQGDVIFATWFTYDAQRQPWWLIAELHKTAAGVYSGPVSTVTGPPFNADPFPPEGSPGGAIETTVGTMTATFSDASHGTIVYTVNGISQTKAIVPQQFGTVPICTWGAQFNLALATNYTDLWWKAPAGSESGWGINFSHQGDIIFATWFTYDAQRQPWWLIAELHNTAMGTHTGPVSTVVGPPFNADPFPPEGSPGGAIETIVGTATLTFADGNAATFAYTVNGVTQTKPITRQVFVPPGTVCQ